MVKPPPSKIRRLELQEAKLRRELKDTLKEISQDTKKRGEKDHLSRVQRQKLANRSVEIRSKLFRLQDEIGTRKIVKEDRGSKQLGTRIQQRYAAAAKRHNQLLRKTIEMQRMKEDELAIRAIGEGKLSLLTRQNDRTSLPTETDTTKTRKIASAVSTISSSSLRQTRELDFTALDQQEHLEHVQKSLSSLGLNNPCDQFHKADGLRHKYELTRDMRNLAHGQMISRPNSNSYWRINPPYRQEKKKVLHVRRAYDKDFYEDKIDITKAKARDVLPTRSEAFKISVRRKEEDALGRFKMISGRTMSVQKMKNFTPPGMQLSV